VPQDADPEQTLIVETRSALGRDRLERSVTVARSYKVLLTSDKPLYQPGQVIHVRALALDAFSLRPAAEQPVEFVIADPKGNKVFRQTETASANGIAAVDFQLATEVNTGAYKITAQVGDTTSEKTVTVKHYVLPKFKVEASTDKTYYRPGETVTGKVAANYFFGKSVQDGQVAVNGYTYDVELEQVVAVQGRTDAEGNYEFSFDLPDYLVGSALETGVASFVVEVAVTDQADHTERINLSLPVAEQAILIEAVPESGRVRPHVENILYVVTAYPDGSPAQCDVTVTIQNETYQAQTSEYGLAEIRFTPTYPYLDVLLAARDARGNTGQAQLYLTGDWQQEYLLLRPERAAYRVGETMRLEVFTSRPVGTVYLDIVREGQTVSTRALDVTDAHAAAEIDLTTDLYGTLELHAYKILSQGQIARDTRLVLVDAPRDLSVAVRADKDTYAPGETAQVSFDVTDAASGQGAAAALGLAIVDESVFALQEQDPGFLKLYFLLERELMQPKYQIKYWSWQEVMAPPEEQEEAILAAQDVSAKAALAAAPVSSFGLTADSHQEKLRQAEQKQAGYAQKVANGLLPVVLLIPVAVVVLAGFALVRDRVLGKSLLAGFVLLILLAIPVVAAQTPSWYDTPQAKLFYFLEELFDEGFALLCLPVVALAGLIGLIVLVRRAVKGPDRPLGIQLLLWAVYLLLLLPLLFALAIGQQEPSQTSLIVFLVGYALLPLAFLLRGIGFGFKKQAGPLIAGLAVSALVLFSGVLPLAVAVGPFVGAAYSGVVNRLDAQGIVVEKALPMPAATMMPEVALEKEAPGEEAGAASAGEAPRLRQFFPETLFWLPEVETDAAGRLSLDIPMADSITTWRLSALASSQDGRLGAATAGLRVFQDFFVDIDLPVSLTQNDEVSMPVAVHNYLKQGQRVTLTLEEADWFEILDEPSKELYIEANDVEAVYFRVRVTAVSGRYRPRVLAIGERMSDYTTATHDVIVYPDGKRFEYTASDRLQGSVAEVVSIPSEAINGTARITVKIYPGIVSQVVEGLEKILRLPYG
jgi:5-hydroxyisourate hydrolase-like protein (transthyretin family)